MRILYPMRKFKTFIPHICIGAGVLAGVAGCATTPKEPVVTFTTHIHIDGTKSFEYLSAAPTKSKRDTKKHSDGKPPRGDKPPKADKPRSQSKHEKGPSKEVIAQRAQQRITELLNTNGYCKEGYITLDEHIVRESFAIKGQCIEQANEDDRILFPNAHKPKVIEEVIDPL